MTSLHAPAMSISTEPIAFSIAYLVLDHRGRMYACEPGSLGAVVITTWEFHIKNDKQKLLVKMEA